MPAITELGKLIEKADSDSVKVSAIREVLDRCGYRLPEKVESESNVTISVVYESTSIPDPLQAEGAHSNGKAHSLS